jgi:hypothetical protein
MVDISTECAYSRKTASRDGSTNFVCTWRAILTSSIIEPLGEVNARLALSACVVLTNQVDRPKMVERRIVKQAAHMVLIRCNIRRVYSQRDRMHSLTSMPDLSQTYHACALLERGPKVLAYMFDSIDSESIDPILCHQACDPFVQD